MQITAFGVVKANGETGILPTGINFQFGPTQGQSSISLSSASASTNTQPKVCCEEACIFKSLDILECIHAGYQVHNVDVLRVLCLAWCQMAIT